MLQNKVDKVGWQAKAVFDCGDQKENKLVLFVIKVQEICLFTIILIKQYDGRNSRIAINKSELGESDGRNSSTLISQSEFTRMTDAIVNYCAVLSLD